MRGLLLGGLLATLAVAALGLWLRGGERPAPALPPVSLPHPAASAPESAPEAVAAAPGPAATAPAPPHGLEVRPGAKRVAPAERPVSALPPADPVPSLDQLLQLPPAEPAAPQSFEWAGEREEPAPGERRRERRVRVDYSREDLAEGVPMQAGRRRTDVGVSVSVDESDRLRVRGGVRVDEREKSEDEREADRTPTVGVEVRF